MDIVIDVASVDSGHPGFDKHLVSPDFFDSKEFAKITFKIKRSDFGVIYGVEQGSLGDTVTLTAAFELGAEK